MGKKCPPGVICIENVTMLLAGCILFGIIYLVKSYPYTHTQQILPIPTQKGVAINVPTQPFDTSYRQIGILSRNSEQDVIMGLFGMQMNRGRELWQYYTKNEHGIRLPVSVNGKSGSNEYGCDHIENGDMIYVEGYNDAFKATIYDDNNQMRYIPSI